MNETMKTYRDSEFWGHESELVELHCLECGIGDHDGCVACCA
jgi:hypothetical protein